MNGIKVIYTMRAEGLLLPRKEELKKGKKVTTKKINTKKN